MAGLKPVALWRNFAELCERPRRSGHEGPAAHLVMEKADVNNLSASLDDAGNVLVLVPASRGCERWAPLCVQCHLDMVCVKRKGVRHNFATDAIGLVRKGKRLYADGTSLGADNGIGVAAMLAIMSDRGLKHGPLELLFTADEEVGFGGIKGFDFSRLKSRRVINLDSESENIVYVGCAGGGQAEGVLPCRFSTLRAVESNKACCLSVSNLAGGHSGDDIHRGRGNAIKLLARILLSLPPSSFHLLSMQGGEAANAIPRDASARLILGHGSDFKTVSDAVAREAAAIAKEYGLRKPKLRICFVRVRRLPAERVASSLSEFKLLRVLSALPNGVLAVDPNAESLVVQTSNNVGLLRFDGRQACITSMFRSSVMPEMDAVARSMEALFALAGGRMTVGNVFPAWPPKYDFGLLRNVKQIHLETLGVMPDVQTMHAGLECALLAQSLPSAKIVSFGPTMCNVHSPDEYVETASVKRFWRLLKAILAAS
ncbi:MAG: beta-Ala-His dipeptidase [Patescibacteria group bacterium]|nr:beta-Ala-His dipeptidase [Patescibacteria group bacterium]